MRTALLLALLLGAACTRSPAPAAPSADAPALRVGAREVPFAFAGMPPPGTVARCPVSHAVFAVRAETAHSEHQGKTYVFCCADCKGRFDADPAKVLARPPPRTSPYAEIAPDAPPSFEAMPRPGTTGRCPISGERFIVDEHTPSSVYAGRTFVFCCRGCKARFDAEPARYAVPAPASELGPSP